MLRRLLVVLLVLPAVLLSWQPAMAANSVCEQADASGLCLLWASDGGSGGGNAGGGGSSVVTLVVDGKSCLYVGLKNPQPPKTDAVWEGHTDGAIHQCNEMVNSGGGGVVRVGWIPVPLYFWSPPASPDAQAVAQQAVSEMDLAAPQLGVTGLSANPGAMEVVGSQTWMWVADPGDSTTGPIVRSASAGGVTVSATGTLDKTVWDMGDGSTVTCAGSAAAGTPWVEADGWTVPSPTCGHQYMRTSAHEPGKKFTVQVTAYWTIAWSGGGQVGVIAMQLSRTALLAVGELQTIVVDRSGG